MRTILSGIAILALAFVFPHRSHCQPAYLDPDFDPHLNSGAQLYSLTLQSDGRILICGSFTSVAGTSITNIARLNSDGSLDGTFNPGTAADLGFVNTIVVQPDGKVLIGGAFSSSTLAAPANLARLNQDGTPDTNFDPNLSIDSAVNTVRLQNDGNIVLGGAFVFINGFERRSLARLKSDGTLDTLYDACVSATAGDGATDLILLSDGKMLASGRLVFDNGAYRDGIARLEECGDLDASYAPQPGVDLGGAAFALALRQDDRVLLAGNFLTYHGESHRGIVQLNTNGIPDSSFNPNTGIFFGATVNTVVIQEDGRALLGGSFTESNGQTRYRVARMDLEGNIDLEFDPGSGPNNSIGFIAIQSDGNLLIAGKFDSFDGVPRNGIARLLLGVPNHLPLADASATKQIYISSNNSNALVTLNGSRSSDSDGEPLEFTWYESGQSVPLALGMLAETVLPLGEHSLELVVTDTKAASTNTLSIQVLTPAQGVERLMNRVERESPGFKPLVTTLSVASASLNRGNRWGAMNALFVFEIQVNRHLASVSPLLAEELIQDAEEITDALALPRTKLPAHPRLNDLRSLLNRVQKRHEKTP